MKASQKLMILSFGVMFTFYNCGKGADSLSHIGFCGNYPDESSSNYVLPITVGTSAMIGQGNCSGASHFGKFRYAYDFSLDIGTDVIAIRSGTVVELQESYEDGNGCPDANYIRIRHSDNTLATYVHLTQGGAAVSIGQAVNQGDVIGQSGNTGCSSGPHLHVHVLDEDGEESIPVSFSNTRSHPGGLQSGKSYTAN